MATLHTNYNIVVGVDCGYDATKITVNGICFEIPSDIVEITGKDQNIGNIKKSNYICSTYIEDSKHLIGEQARMLLSETEYKVAQNVKKDIMDSYDRFTTQDATIHLVTSIAMALIKYSEYTMEKHIKPEFDIRKKLDKDSLFKIYINLGYPNDVYEKVYKSVKPKVATRHAFTIETEYDEYNLDFEILSKNMMAFSQAQAAYLGLISDDAGNIQTDNKYFSKIPCLVLDGGQKTMGIYKVTSNYQIEADESNTNYAMNNVYERVVNEIRKEYGRNDIEVYNISNYLNYENGKIAVVNQETGETEILDIKPIVEKHQKEVCKELIEYIENKFNSLLDVKQIIAAGGTGSAFYQQLKEYTDEKKKHLDGNVYLAKYKFMGKEINPVFAISIGLYKVLLQSILEEEENSAE